MVIIKDKVRNTGYHQVFNEQLFQPKTNIFKVSGNKLSLVLSFVGQSFAKIF